MTVDEAASALGVSRSAVRKAIARGTLAARLEEGRYRVAPAEVERYRVEHLLARYGESRDREAYLAVGESLALLAIVRREGVAQLTLEDLDPEMVELAHQYARRRRRRWPPR